MKVILLISAIVLSYTYGQSTNTYFMSNKRKIYLNERPDLVAVKFKNYFLQAKSFSLQKRVNNFVNRHSTLEKMEKNFGGKVVIFSLKNKDIEDAKINSITKSLKKDSEVLSSRKVFSLKGYTSPMVLTGNIIIKFLPEVNKNGIDKILTKYNLNIESQSKIREGRVVALLDVDDELNVFDVSNSIYNSGLVEYCHPDFIIEVDHRTYIPNDEYFPDQWHLNNTGQGNGKLDADVDALEAWGITRGRSEVRIAVIDDAIDHGHPDLIGNVIYPRDEVNDDNDPSPDEEEQYHGTLVAGVAAAVGNNIEGVTGICPECSLIPIRATFSGGGTFADIADAFDYAVSVDADIINNSWGSPLFNYPDDIVDAINNAATNGRKGKGAVVFFAMSNETFDNCEGEFTDISSLENVIAISKSNNLDELDNGGFGECMEFLAPTGIPTTDVEGDDWGIPWNSGDPDYYHHFGGTSASTPLAAGIGGLILSIIPGLDRQQVQYIMESTADKIQPNIANYDSEGFSSTHGYGRVNAFKATRLASWYGIQNSVYLVLN